MTAYYLCIAAKRIHMRWYEYCVLVEVMLLIRRDYTRKRRWYTPFTRIGIVLLLLLLYHVKYITLLCVCVRRIDVRRRKERGRRRKAVRKRIETHLTRALSAEIQ